MSAAAFEAFLARLYTDAAFRARVLADPRGEAERAGLDARRADAVARIDRVGLELAAESFARKREHGAAGWWARLTRAWSGSAAARGR